MLSANAQDAQSAQCVAAGDQRASTPALREALIAGLRAGGVDVLEIGLAPSAAGVLGGGGALPHGAADGRGDRDGVAQSARIRTG